MREVWFLLRDARPRRGRGSCWSRVMYTTDVDVRERANAISHLFFFFLLPYTGEGWAGGAGGAGVLGGVARDFLS